MDLLIDLGNSRVKWACSAPGVWETGAALLPANDLQGFLDGVWAPLSTPQRVVAASVVNAVRYQELEHWVGARWSLAVERVSGQRELLGVKNHYRDPASLGADRWAALIAARHMTTQSAGVVSCGTAVTVDALSREGEFLGGVIFPGLRTLRLSLAQATDGVRATTGNDGSCFARSTGDGVAAGTLFGLVGAIERVLAEHRTRLGALEVILTGADAPLVAARTELTVSEVPDLVLRGLALIARHGS